MNREVWRQPGDPALYVAIAAVWTAGRRLLPRRFPPGVHRYRSVEAMEAAADRWRREQSS